MLRAEALQWFALFGGAFAWTGQFVVGFYVAVARCSPGSEPWGIDQRAWAITLTAAAAAVVLAAEAAAIVVATETWGVEEDGPPPAGRRHFFAVAAVVGNVLFLGAVVLGGIGTVAHPPCQSA